ncbi:MAG: hypothetical protein MUF45_10315 [Spirosomaceae bacterium]|nr:hypothetical protein [Spirosomataceae bacterium]
MTIHSDTFFDKGSEFVPQSQIDSTNNIKNLTVFLNLASKNPPYDLGTIQ